MTTPGAEPVVPTPGDLARLAADHIESHPTTYEELSSGPLGEALTAAELHTLAGDSEALASVVSGMRAMADDYDRWARIHAVNVGRMARLAQGDYA